jgi:hypothetical protein
LTDGCVQSIVYFNMSLENAILQTLAYSDIFDYPLTADELHRFLVLFASEHDIEQCAAKIKDVSLKDRYYFLAGRDEIVELRKRREAVSRKILKRAMFYGRILGALPFVRMVALTGSLAMLNLSKNPDMDFMLVTKHRRVWTARAFAIVFGKIARLFGDTICPNLIISEHELEWPLHDLYSARELCQMIPIAGIDYYMRLFAVNSWVESFLPNAHQKTSEVFPTRRCAKTSEVWRTAELPLQGTLGDKLESWEMTRKIKKFSAQPGFGPETVFTADVCQGNFNHHRKWTQDVYQERLSALGIKIEERGLESAVFQQNADSSPQSM